jgi:hypothetical protein
MATATSEETTARCDAKKINVGSVFSRRSHGVVVGIRADTFTLRNESGFEWDIRGANILEEEFSFADQHDSDTKESRTAVIEALKLNPHTAMTICFHKKPDPKHIATELAKGQGDMKPRAWNSTVKKLMEGEERIMVGHSTGIFDEHQRLKFIEMTKGPRLVDTRTLKWMVVDRIKYVVK